MLSPQLCHIPSTCVTCPVHLLSGRPHHIPVFAMSTVCLRLSYSLSAVYSICATVALQLQSASGDSERRSYNGNWLQANWFLCSRHTETVSESALYPLIPPPFLFSPFLPACQPQMPQVWHPFRTHAWANMCIARYMWVVKEFRRHLTTAGLTNKSKQLS